MSSQRKQRKPGRASRAVLEMVFQPKGKKAPELETCGSSPTGNHHFLLPPPSVESGIIAEGICKYCGSRRDHLNVHDSEIEGWRKTKLAEAEG